MKILRQVLGDATDEQLAKIFHLWTLAGELADKSMKQQIDALIHRMRTNPIAVRFAWDGLTDDERQILYRVLPQSTRYGVSSSLLLKQTKLPPARYEAALQALVEYALVQQTADSSRVVVSTSSSTRKATQSVDTSTITAFTEIADVLYMVAREYFTPSGDRSKWDFARLLQATLPQQTISNIMNGYGIPRKVSGYYYQDDIDVIADQIIGMGEPLEHLPMLDSQARELFIWLRRHEGKADVETVKSALKIDNKTLLTNITTLTMLGLVFDSFSKGKHVVFVPHDLYINLDSLDDSQIVEEIIINALEKEPPAVRTGEHIVVYDIATLVNTIYQQTIEPTQAGRVPKRIATKVRTTLRGQPRMNYDDSDDYIEMLLNFMEHIDIIGLTKPTFQEGKPAYEVVSGVDQWAKKSLIEQTHALLSYWLEDFAWRDVYGAKYRSWQTYAWDTSSGRRALLKHLLNYKSGDWYSVDALLAEIWREDAFTYRSTTNIYGRSRNIVRDANTKDKWDSCEGEVYRGILSSTLFELGIVDIGYKHPDALSSNIQINPDYFFVTEFGRKVLQLSMLAVKDEDVQTQNSTSGLVVQPNFELLLLQPDLATLYALLPFTQANGLGLVSRLTLTKASVLHGLQAGKNVDGILQTLQGHSQKELPQNVEYTLRDWTKTFKSASISQVLLFDVSSEDAGKILPLIPALQEYGIRQLGPCTFAVSGGVNLQTVRKELEKAGIFVRISGEIFSRPKTHYDSYTMYGRY